MVTKLHVLIMLIKSFFEFITVVSKDIPSEGKAKVLLFRRDFFAFWDCCIQYMD